MDTVEIGDAKMPLHSTVAEVHIRGTVVASIVVAAVSDPRILHFCVCQFLTCLSVDDRHIDRWVTLRLRTVVRDAVAIGVGINTAAHIPAPSLVLLIPKAGAVATANDNLAASVAVDVVGHYHVVLSGTDIHIGSHIDSPQQRAVEFVGLYLMRGGGRVVLGILSIIVVGSPCKQAVYHHGIVLAIAIEVHRPAVLRTVVVALDDVVVEVEVEPHIRVCLRLIQERCAHLTLHAVGRDGRHGILRIVGQSGLQTGHRQRFCIDFRIRRRTLSPFIHIIGSPFGFLGEFTPRDERTGAPS